MMTVDEYRRSLEVPESSLPARKRLLVYARIQYSTVFICIHTVFSFLKSYVNLREVYPVYPETLMTEVVS